MKKLVCIVIIMLLTLGVSITENILSTKYYTKIRDELEIIDEYLMSNNFQENKPIVSKKMNTLQENWNKNQHLIMAFSNHAVIRTLDEKLICIKAWIDNDKFDNAHEFCVTAIELTEDMIDDTHLTLSNFL